MTHQNENNEDPRFHKAVERVLSSYVSHGGINHIEGVNLPSREVVVELLSDLHEVLFPGYFSRTALESRNVRYVVGQRLARIFSSLTSETLKALRHEHRLGPSTGPWNHEAGIHRARELSLGLIEAIPEIRRVLREDALAAYEGDPAAASVVVVILSYPSDRAFAANGIAHLLHVYGVPLIPRMMTEHEHSITGIDIHPGAEIGEGLFVDHGTGVVIGETSVIGKRVKIYQGVTLGALSVRRQSSSGKLVKRHPTLEDETTIYSGATILGGDTVIGKGSVVGGNVWLTRSVPPGTKVMIDAPYLVYEKVTS